MTTLTYLRAALQIPLFWLLAFMAVMTETVLLDMPWYLLVPLAAATGLVIAVCFALFLKRALPLPNRSEPQRR